MAGDLRMTGDLGAGGAVARPRSGPAAVPVRAVAVLVAGLLLVTSLVLAPATSADAVVGEACPSARVPATAFTDTTRSVHRAAIDCLAWWDITRGRSATVYDVGGEITRGQMAAMIARLVATTDYDPGTPTVAGFTDTAGHLFEDEINLLAAAGVVRGVTATTYEPDRSVSRAEMASLLARMFERTTSAALPPGPMPFTDVSSSNVHRDAIARLVAADITAGVTATRYAPSRAVTRAQMASFMMRAASVLVTRGDAAPPAGEPDADDVYASSLRGAWVHLFDDTLKSRRGIRDLVDEMVAADANVIIAQVARRHDAYYDSDVLPPTPDPRLEADLDVLDRLLRVAHREGIEVHAWISVAPTWHQVYDQLGLRPGSLGAPLAWRTRTVDGAVSDYLDPALRPVQNHVAAIVGEIAERYPVDGIHLDYVRYQSERHGYHPDALARFRAETGFLGTPAPDNRDWSRWRRDQTQQIMVRARRAIEAADSDASLSAAVITWGDGPSVPTRNGFQETLSYRRVLQDWDRWARAGIVDELMPMNYFREANPEHAGWLRQWMRYQRALTAESDVQLAAGIGGYLNAPAATLTQTYLGMERVDGAILYSYQQPTLDHSRDVLDRLAATRWGYPPAAP
jgi:uncharacterized lipoprotein YddW (UPF0748 family)